MAKKAFAPAFLGATQTYTIQDIKNILTTGKDGIQYNTQISPVKQISDANSLLNNTGITSVAVFYTIPSKKKLMLTSLSYILQLQPGALVSKTITIITSDGNNLLRCQLWTDAINNVQLNGDKVFNLPFELNENVTLTWSIPNLCALNVVLTGYLLDI